MLFNSQEFILFFLPITLLVFLFLSARASTTWALFALVFASLFFYSWWNPAYLLLLVGSVIVNFSIARLMVHERRKSRGRLALATLGITFNLGVLGYFKYAGFLFGSFAEITGTAFSLTATTLPLAISFFTFQQISYLVDVWRNRGREYDLLRYAAYVTFFPQLIAGPIVRHHELIPQFSLSPLRDGFSERLGRGSVLFCIGLFKKVFIADALADIVDPAYAEAAASGVLSFSEAWLAAFAFAWQIYFDFSGYSDMALGLAWMFGYKLPVNFNVPYASKSLREIWTRWHMTLSRFLRDYLFVPLARNKYLINPRLAALVVTMFLGGLWHGAAWTFVAWGLAHGVGLIVNTAFTRSGFTLPQGMGWLLTLLFWVETAVLFRADSFATVGVFWAAMHDLSAPIMAADIGEVTLVIMAGLIAILGPASQDFAFDRIAPRKRVAALAGIVLAATIVAVGGGSEQEFIYFQF